MRKTTVVWVRPAGGPTYPVWTVWTGRDALVLSGGAEQPAPGLAEARAADVLVRSRDDRALLVSWPALVTVVPPGTDDWTAALPLLLAGRLNLPDGGDRTAVADRWARTSVLNRLQPAHSSRDVADRAV